MYILNLVLVCQFPNDLFSKDHYLGLGMIGGGGECFFLIQVNAGYHIKCVQCVPIKAAVELSVYSNDITPLFESLTKN